MYDSNNIFAKIIRNEIPSKKILETQHSLSFEDINPSAPIHILIIPKKAYMNFHEFIELAEKAEILDFNRVILELIDINNLKKDGYKIITNTGNNGGQEVPHYHVHLLGGKIIN